MRKVLTDAARNGLPGEHHFNIAFKTQAPGVVVPAAMRQRYPDEMAIILQHEFWELEVNDDGFEVSLNFSRKPERLTIPFDSITGFSDPSVPFGFKLEPRGASRGACQGRASPARDDAQIRAGRSLAQPAANGPTASKSAEAAAKKADRAREGEPAKVVSIDAFRKKVKAGRRWAKSSICAGRARASDRRELGEADAAANRLTYGVAKAAKEQARAERERAEQTLEAPPPRAGRWRGMNAGRDEADARRRQALADDLRPSHQHLDRGRLLAPPQGVSGEA